MKAALLVLALAWVAIIAFVGTAGEYMVNDDWSFVRAYERFVHEGRIESTGWGPEHAPGGPALLVHLLWARLVTLVTGNGIVTLRISVLIMGILGSIALWALLRSAGGSPLTALVGVLTLIFNPFYLSQGFTFMTDVPFTAVSLWAMYFLSRAVETGRLGLLIAGLLCTLAAILIRQLGAVIVLGFLSCCVFHSKARELGFARCLAWTMGLVVVPWAAYELAIGHAGGTPLTHHQAVGNIIKHFSEHSWAGYVQKLSYGLLAALAYCGLCTAPVWLLRFDQFLAKKGFRLFLATALAVFAVVQAVSAVDRITLPVFFWGNVIYDFGIGPILLKDTAILKMPRTATIPARAYYAWVLVAMVGIAIIVGRARIAILSLLGRGRAGGGVSFPAALALTSSAFYTAVICASGYHDRYVLPVIAFFIVWLCAEDPDRGSVRRNWRTTTASLCMVGIIGGLSLVGTRDFVRMKRAVAAAQEYVSTELRYAPCSWDGGFEYNGYHCYDKRFRPRPGMSWWWVNEEKCVLTLGPLPGYRVEHVVPFGRIMGPDGAVHVLVPEAR